MADDLIYAPESVSAESLLVRPVWSILAKGFTGSGKTIFGCGKAFRPVYVFDCEGRFDSVLSYYRKLDGHVKDIYTNHFPLTDGFFKLDKKMDAIVARPEYKTVVMSSLTSFIRLILLHLKRSSIQKSDDSGRVRGVRKKGGIQANILEDYNFEDAAIIDELIGFFQILKSMGINTILEAHITPYEVKTINEDTGDKDLYTIMEILTKGKKAPAEVPSWFNEVWLMEKKVGNNMDPNSRTGYWVNTVGNNSNSTKTSFGIPSFEWTGKDGSMELMKYLNPDIAKTERVDPSKPKIVGW
jgi:hypothetical protein